MYGERLELQFKNKHEVKYKKKFPKFENLSSINIPFLFFQLNYLLSLNFQILKFFFIFNLMFICFL